MTLTRRISAAVVFAFVLLAPGVASAQAVTCVGTDAVSADERQVAPAATRCLPTP